MKNSEVAAILYEIADFLEIQDVDFKPRAYRRAARNIEALSEDIEEVAERGQLEEIDGVGESIAEKIVEYLETGELEYYEELKAELPIDIDAITRIEGVGPKSAKKLYDALAITSLDELEAAAESGDIAAVDGFGEKSQQNILEHIELARQGEERMLLGRAIPIVEAIEADLESDPAFDEVEIVGSFRRRRPTVGDIDILATAPDPLEAMAVFTGQSDVEEVLSQGETRASIRASGGLQMDLRIVEADSWGAAKQYFTGSKAHNITVRSLAIEQGWKLNEYGLFAEDESTIAGETEAGIYEALELAWIPPELREDTGEVAAAADGRLPELLEVADIRGDLQMHSTASDGSNSIVEMAEKAASLEYDYILITDHGPSLQVASGIDRSTFEEQAPAVKEATATTGVAVLHGIEANITADGLDVDPDWCRACDLVVVALHDRLSNASERITRAIEEYPVDILAHPQNRILNERKPLELDFESIMPTAAANNVAIEINAQPDRLDLDWRTVKEYRDTVKYVISTDAHVTASMDYMHLGVSQARRGWCEPENILNTASLGELLEYFDA